MILRLLHATQAIHVYRLVCTSHCPEQFASRLARQPDVRDSLAVDKINDFSIDILQMRFQQFWIAPRHLYCVRHRSFMLFSAHRRTVNS